MKKIILLIIIIFFVGCIVIQKEYKKGINYSFEYEFIMNECKETNKGKCLELISTTLKQLDMDIGEVEKDLQDCLSRYDNEKVCNYLVIKKKDLLSWKEKFIGLKEQSLK